MRVTTTTTSTTSPGAVPAASRSADHPNAVAAVPEFVDESCGILAPPEDAAALAAGIAALYHDPERFLRMSRAAAERVRRQCAAERLAGREIAAFGGVARAV